MKTIRLFFLLVFPALLLSSFCFGHPGGFDSKGGHKNSQTGEYHYHNGGKSFEARKPVISAPVVIQQPVAPKQKAIPKAKIAAGSGFEDLCRELTSLIDTEKLATLKNRGTNPRIQKAVAIIEGGRQKNFDLWVLCRQAVARGNYNNVELAKATVMGLMRNHGIAEKLGVLNEVGLNDMKQGQSPTIQNGPYTGDELSVDHIVPRAVAPELDNVIANLELMPLRMNKSKSAKMGARQYDFAKKFRDAGLLSETRLDEVLSKR